MVFAWYAIVLSQAVVSSGSLFIVMPQKTMVVAP